MLLLQSFGWIISIIYPSPLIWNHSFLYLSWGVFGCWFYNNTLLLPTVLIPKIFFLLYVGFYWFLFLFSLLCPCLIFLLPTKIKSLFYIICKWSVTQSQSLGTILGLFTLLLVYCELLLYSSSDYSLHSSTYLLLLTKLIPSRISLYRSSSLIPSPCYYLQTFPNNYS